MAQLRPADQSGLATIRRVLAALAVVTLGMLAYVAGVIGSTSASASAIPGAILGVTVTPPNPAHYQSVTTDIDYCVHNAKAGDTFSLTLPNQLTSYPPSFPLTGPNGVVVGAVTIKQNPPPAVATFTLSSYVNGLPSVCGTATFSAAISSTVKAGTTTTLKYTSNDNTVFSAPITVQPGKVIGRTTPRKYGTFTDSTDTCDTNVTDCLQWAIETPAGPAKGATITDPMPAGQTLDCSSVGVLVGVAASDTGQFIKGKAYSDFTKSCASNTLTVTIGAIPSDMIVQVKFRISVSGTHDPGTTYADSASVDVTNSKGVTKKWQVHAHKSSGSGSGNGSGSVSPTSPSTTPSTSAPTTSATTTTPGTSFAVEATTITRARPSSAAVAMTSAVVALAFTGAGNIGPMLGVAIGLFAIGSGLLFAGRRRRGAHS